MRREEKKGSGEYGENGRVEAEERKSKEGIKKRGTERQKRVKKNLVGKKE